MMEGDRETSHPVWSSDGARLFFASRDPGKAPDVYSLDHGNGNLEPVLRSADPEWPLCVSPGGKELFCLQGTWLVSAPVEGGPPRRIGQWNTKSHPPGVSTGVSLFCPRETGSCVLVVATADSLVFRSLIPGGGAGPELFRRHRSASEWFVALSPDGSRLVTGDRNSEDVSILDASTGVEIDRIHVSNPAAVYQDAGWSRDGSLYLSGMDGDAHYWLRRRLPEKPEEVIWSSEDVFAAQPAVSPDGRRLAFGTLEWTAALWLMEGF